jgi:hypothetical protein
MDLKMDRSDGYSSAIGPRTGQADKKICSGTGTAPEHMALPEDYFIISEHLPRWVPCFPVRYRN